MLNKDNHNKVDPRILCRYSPCQWELRSLKGMRIHHPGVIYTYLEEEEEEEEKNKHFVTAN